MPRKRLTKRQAGFFGAVASGKARKRTKLNRRKAREMLRGARVKG